MMLGALAGCAAPAPPTELRADLPPRWAMPNPVDPAAPAPDLAHWWHVLGGAELDRLVERALDGNLGLAAATRRVAAARSLLLPAEASLRPTLRFETGATPNPDSRSSWFQAGFDARWELGLFGRAEAVRGLARAELGSAEADLAAARVSLVAEVVRTWLEAGEARGREVLLERILDLQRERLRLWQVRRQAEQAAPDELSRAHIALGEVEVARIEASFVRQVSHQRMALLLGDRSAAQEMEGKDSDESLAGLRVGSAPADLLRTRPEIRRAEQRVLKAASAAGEARADLYPRLSLGGVLSAAVAMRGAASGLHTALAAGPVVDMPLFDWGARRALVDARDAELAAALLDYRQSVLDGVTEVQSALLALQAQEDRVAGLLRTRTELERIAGAASARGRLGLADGIERLGAEVASLQGEVALRQARLAQALAFVALYKALGGSAPGAATEHVSGAVP
jgi:outer membrane protein, multidrug efflux system